MSSSPSTSGEWVAKRFTGKPLKQPLYQFSDIPKCSKDLSGSTIYEVTKRDDFVDATAEMVLLCNEAMKRSRTKTDGKKKKTSSKPLSLEYIADRLDIDDPIFGLFVRDDAESRLQGFITCTTFTNWQKTFRWDSMHDSAFSYDDTEMALDMLTRKRRYDHDGSLAAELQSTIRCGDPWEEGIVWPRIAEISLLGALGCGRHLVQLMLERLESLRATREHNYDYVVLQATENSIPFYEAMGFVRVGALTEDEQFEDKHPVSAPSQQQNDSETETDSDDSTYKSSQQNVKAEALAEPVDSSTPVDSQAAPSQINSSPVLVHVVKKAGETPLEIAKKYKVDVWDIIFLNHFMYKDMTSRSYLYKDTTLYIPALSKTKADATTFTTSEDDLLDPQGSKAPRWYLAKNNDTPKMIAKQFGINVADVLIGNRGRLPLLQPNSRLRPNTRIRVSHFRQHDDVFVPYCHWTFPDDSFEQGEPSYMMAKRLNRRSTSPRPDAKGSPVPAPFPIKKYIVPPSKLFATIKQQSPTASKSKGTPSSTRKKRGSLISMPVRPKRPPSAFLLFCNQQRPIVNKEMPGSRASDIAKVLSERWKELGDGQKSKYHIQHKRRQVTYQRQLEKYKRNLERFYEDHPDMRQTSPAEQTSDEEQVGDMSFFNQVVRIRPNAVIGDNYKEFQYYYVLTYIPDLQWCHLAPMRQSGYWNQTQYPSCGGRPIWMLVDESEGKEVDISSTFCEIVKAEAMKRTVDADKEQWDIAESGEARKRKRKTTEKKQDSTSPGSNKNVVTPRPAKKPKLAADSDTSTESDDSMQASDLEFSTPANKKERPVRRKKTPGAQRELPPRRAAPTMVGMFTESPQRSQPKPRQSTETRIVGASVCKTEKETMTTPKKTVSTTPATESRERVVETPRGKTLKPAKSTSLRRNPPRRAAPTPRSLTPNGAKGTTTFSPLFLGAGVGHKICT